MLVSLEWLNEFVDISNLSAEEISHGLTMSGLEVEDIEKLGADFTNIVVAEIKEINPHPDAEKLQLATVFNGTETRTVVCGAKNIAAGQMIPYASVGSEVLDRKSGEKFTLKPAKIRGVESQGMLCSADELGLESSKYQEEDGILILNRFLPDVKPGEDVKKVLNIQEDTVINIAPTANRGDEMSIIGVAREVASIFNRPMKHHEIMDFENTSEVDFNVEIKDQDTCKYYSLGLLKDVKIKPAPEWMTRRLLASGVRSINNVVDITNYIMLEYGQPLHAFDMNKLNSNCICVKRAYEGEKIITLDEIERSLTTDSVLIATDKEPVALAGLMGGYNSEVDDNTTRIALESAYFTPPTNRKSSRSVGLRTEAVSRFERGVDIEFVKPALVRAMDLMVKYADAKACGIVETGDNKLPNIEITLRYAQLKRILGIDIPASRCKEILSNLGFEFLGGNDFSAKYLVPSYRANDVTREIDLIEEIARIHGYDKIEPELPPRTISPDISEEVKNLDKINKIMLGNGFNEIVTSSLLGEPLVNWVGIGYDDSKAVKVSNPQSDEYTMLRQSLVPSIIQVVKYNFDQGQKNLWIYELGKTFSLENTPDKRNSGVEERRILAGAITGNISSGKWHTQEEVDFYALKGVVEKLISELNLENRVEYKPASDVVYLHPGRAAEVRLLGKNSEIIGIFGELHPDTREKCKLSQPVYIFEINLEKVLKTVLSSVPRYKELPLYPEVKRDIAFVIPQEVAYQDIARNIKKAASSNLFRGLEIFDVYQGKNIPENSKSLAYRVTFQDVSATLTDEIVNQEMEKIRQGLKKAYPEATFRE